MYILYVSGLIQVHHRCSSYHVGLSSDNLYKTIFALEAELK